MATLNCMTTGIRSGTGLINHLDCKDGLKTAVDIMEKGQLLKHSAG
jgi:hypothetical protein